MSDSDFEILKLEILLEIRNWKLEIFKTPK